MLLYLLRRKLKMPTQNILAEDLDTKPLIESSFLEMEKEKPRKKTKKAKVAVVIQFRDLHGSRINYILEQMAEQKADIAVFAVEHDSTDLTLTQLQKARNWAIDKFEYHVLSIETGVAKNTIYEDKRLKANATIINGALDFVTETVKASHILFLNAEAEMPPTLIKDVIAEGNNVVVLFDEAIAYAAVLVEADPIYKGKRVKESHQDLLEDKEVIADFTLTLRR